MRKWIVTKDYHEMSQKAAKEVSHKIKEQPNLVLGLSTGGTPVGTYQTFIELHKESDLDFSRVTTFNLDEYVGLSEDHPQSYTYYMWNNLFSEVNIDKNNIHIPSGIFEDENQVLREYDQKLAEAGSIDVMILGIGGNGHIGFNEPNEELKAGTHIASLTEETIQANARFFQDINEVPKQAVAMGVGDILQSKEIILIASGKEKAESIRATFNGKITLQHPSSLLQLHNNVTIIIDEEAASLL
ncbi:glucosamine-6-phosphate deaminase [Gracilibacillus sp. YIM 98692]|uniref:glucosamine-6-phosphate deaminase n=1 Tax=Gracilibacillus sp. YIM 98692 TaxID=2663532 RepID=UPI0013D4F691|nr:glucosamine-6-phosphate deaminase [Gracilibacillus sp. YIM 98692]